MTGLVDFIVFATFAAPLVVLGVVFGTCSAVFLARIAVSSADDNVRSTALGSRVHEIRSIV
jgi:hypothetical protein